MPFVSEIILKLYLSKIISDNLAPVSTDDTIYRNAAYAQCNGVLKYEPWKTAIQEDHLLEIAVVDYGHSLSVDYDNQDTIYVAPGHAFKLVHRKCRLEIESSLQCTNYTVQSDRCQAVSHMTDVTEDEIAPKSLHELLIIQSITTTGLTTPTSASTTAKPHNSTACFRCEGLTSIDDEPQCESDKITDSVLVDMGLVEKAMETGMEIEIIHTNTTCAQNYIQSLNRRDDGTVGFLSCLLI